MLQENQAAGTKLSPVLIHANYLINYRQLMRLSVEVDRSFREEVEPR